MITYHDFLLFLKKERKKILHCFVYSALTLFFLLSLRETQFLSHATFRHEAQKEESNFSPEAILKNLSNIDLDTNAKPFFYSRTILVRVIKELGLQVLPEQNRLFKALSRIKDSLASELRFSLNEPDLFQFKNVEYDGVTRAIFYIRFQDRENYSIFDHRKKLLAHAKLSEPVHFTQATWTLDALPSTLKTNRFYRIKLLPLWKSLDQLQSNLKITNFKSKKTILSLFYSDRSPKRADAILNALMASFQSYLKQENQLIAKQQLAYLEERQNTLFSQFNTSLGDYVAYLKENWGTQGFVGTEIELDHLAHTKRNYQAKLLDFDLELKRFVKAASHTKHAANVQFSMGFQGMDPSVTKHLYLSYNEQLDHVLHEMQQLIFVKNAMKDTQFELSTLKHIISDSYSAEMMEKIAALSFQLRDENNWSIKEQERIKDQLKHQKEQLLSHISQQIELLRIKAHLIEDKMLLLQTSSLDVLENEKELIEEKLLDLSNSLRDLPEKWRLEQQLKFKTTLAEAVMQGVSEVVEGKRIDHELKFINSRPLDPPMSKHKPSFRFLIFKTLFCASLIAAVYTLIHFFKAFRRGLPLSLPTLKNFTKQIIENPFSAKQFAVDLKPDQKKILLVNSFPYLDELTASLHHLGRPARLVDQFDNTDSIQIMQSHHPLSHPGIIDHYVKSDITVITLCQETLFDIEFFLKRTEQAPDVFYTFKSI